MQRKLSPLHFVGIGGIGMAALAELLHAQGLDVSGSDLIAGPTFVRLRELGVRVSVGHDAQSVEGARTVIRSSAIAEDNPELVAARAGGIPIVERGALLAEIMRTKDSIAIGGSHGKTTTSAMTSHLLESAGLDPTALIGGRVPRPRGGASPVKLGHGDLLVAEVDESDASFLLTRPILAVITNVDPEHLDHYGTRAALLDAFVEFANSVPFHGTCFLGIDHPGVREIASRINARKVGFGFAAEADVRAESVESIPGGQRCHVILAGQDRFSFDLPMPGRHNILNALAAISLGLEKDVSASLLGEAIASFPGVARRFERKGRAGGIEVIDDYAHHPAEIRATLDGARSIHAGPITAIFQPHRFTRTRDCWGDFLVAFEDADRIVISDIYPASESPIPGIDGASLARALENTGKRSAYFGGSLDDIERNWPARFEPGELVLTLGAGDVDTLGPRLLAACESPTHGGET
ncbi:MAG: UDP-N-acetylmuramate--L-alanine ligase [Deltaproteobacteria bacterium]|nr:UDP-N-acetylmuramate--L-alanine ligase [Deltaproteobacteria bacterium]